MKTIIYKNLESKMMFDWLTLWENSSNANFVNSPMWIKSVLDNFIYSDYTIIAVYEKKQLCAIAWFIKTKKYGISFHTIVPGDFVYDTPFLFASNDSSLRHELFQAIGKLKSVFIDNVSRELVNEMKKYITDVVDSPSNINLYINLDRKLPKDKVINNRNKLMKKVRKIEDLFFIKSYDKHSTEALETVFNIDNKSRKNSRGYNTFSNTIIKDFYTSLSKNFNKNFSINILYFENKPIAYRMGFIINGTYFGSQIAFIEEYAHFYPGKVLLVKFIEEKSNFDKVDFGSGDNSFKRSVSNGSRPLSKIIISTNIITRNYIRGIYFAKNLVFNQLTKHVKIYTAYRYIKKIMHLRI